MQESIDKIKELKKQKGQLTIDIHTIFKEMLKECKSIGRQLGPVISVGRKDLTTTTYLCEHADKCSPICQPSDCPLI